MKRKLLLLLFILLVLHVTTVHAEQTFYVIKVIDGDTIAVDIRGHKETIRLLGIDTPETVDPRKPVQCFGKAASDKMKTFVHGKQVILVDDSTQGNRDKYGRLLRYVYIPDSVRTFINGEMIKQGYALSYRQYPTKMLDKFNSLENYARNHNRGLWSSCPLSPTHTSISSGGDKDCADFATHAEAQAYFIGKGGSATNNVDKLDTDHDGLACKTLP